jgi:hypothetical protein
MPIINILPKQPPGQKYRRYFYFLLIPSETVNLLRPLERRAANTLRPFAVDILSRNPCLLRLFLTDG